MDLRKAVSNGQLFDNTKCHYLMGDTCIILLGLNSTCGYVKTHWCSHIGRTYKNPTIWIAGDFNLPDTECRTNINVSQLCHIFAVHTRTLPSGLQAISTCQILNVGTV